MFGYAIIQTLRNQTENKLINEIKKGSNQNAKS